MTIDRFCIKNIPSHVSKDCSVYVCTKNGIFPAVLNSSILTVENIFTNTFELEKSTAPVMTDDGKFEKEKIIIYEDGSVRYIPQRKPLKDEEAEIFFREEFFLK